MAVLRTTLFILMHVSLSYKIGRKGITQAKRDYETKNKYNIRGSAQNGHHSFASITVRPCQSQKIQFRIRNHFRSNFGKSFLNATPELFCSNKAIGPHRPVSWTTTTYQSMRILLIQNFSNLSTEVW
jgi:hypothetical protein